MKRLASILLWSVIAAAFIGPGTVTTAATAGAEHGLSLLWALVFSTVACLVLQEASARVTVVSHQTLGLSLRRRYATGLKGLLVLVVVLGAIVVGCAAYEAGNILGGVAGAVLVTGWSPRLLAVLSAAVAAALLWRQAPRTVAKMLSLVVAIMGVAFLVTAWRVGPKVQDLMVGSLVPVLPSSSGILVVGLMGTTVVPYNLFLGSSLAAGQTLRDLRVGLTVAIGLGGVISMAVLVVGTAVTEDFSFTGLSGVLARRLGDWASVLFGVGLLGAGLSSAITAPLAAAVTARDLFRRDEQDSRWSETSWRYRAIWLSVLLTGVGFGLSDVRPIPVIILAQALNGLLLPMVSVFLFAAVNDRRLMGDNVNGAVANTVLAVVVLVSLLLGVSALWRAVAASLGLSEPRPLQIVAVALSLAMLAGSVLARSSMRHRP